MTEPRYEFHELIATGGMGEVWRATDTLLGRDVAIKLLKPEFADDPVNRARFDSEARHAAALTHPHVAAVYDVGEMPTASGLVRPYLVMELVNGKPLSDLVRDGRPLDPDVVRDLLGQAGDALAEAHRAGIVHRDVKPANMLVTPEGQVKVTDFGIARAAGNSAITGTGQVMGTPQYLSPEQARGERATAASDVYALGVVAFECLTGHRPFQKESPVATAIAHLHDPVPPLPEEIPADLRAVVEKALSKDPQDRYADAAAFTEALRGSAGGAPVDGAATQVLAAPVVPLAAADDAAAGTSALPTVVEPAPPVAPMPAGDDGDGTEATAEGGADRAGGRRRTGIILLALLLLAAAAAAVWLLTRGGSDPSPSDTPSQTGSPSRSSQAPETIDLVESRYVGLDVDAAVARLRDLGLQPTTDALANDGTHEAGTVAGLEPTRGLREGDSITVTYWDAAVEEPQQPTEEPDEPTQEPTQEPTDEPTQEPTDEPTEEPTTEEPTEEPTTEEPSADETTEPVPSTPVSPGRSADRPSATPPGREGTQ